MAGNDIYNDRTGMTCVPMRMTNKQAEVFMEEVSKHPTHPTKQWVIKDIRTGSRIYYTNEHRSNAL